MKRRPKKLECAILFLHFQDDAVTRHHLRLLRKMNPFLVIPIVRGNLGVKDAIDVQTPETQDFRGWRHPDIHIYNWFKRREISAERYVCLEWDVFASQPLKEFYGARWDAPVVGMNLHKVESSDWMWFREAPELPPELRPFAMGIEPLSLVLLRHEVLEAICSRPIPPDIFCELRLGTLVRAAGFAAVDFPEARETVRFGPMRNIIDAAPATPGVFHPVKDLLLAPPRREKFSFLRRNGVAARS